MLSGWDDWIYIYLPSSRRMDGSPELGQLGSGVYKKGKMHPSFW